MEQKYRDVFKEVFGVQENILNDTFSKNSVKDWDSVHQLNIIASLEDAFDIMFDPEDIMEVTSFKVGKEILRKYGIKI